MVKNILTTLLALLISSLFSSQSFSGVLKVGLVLDKGGKDDKSFNSAAYAGATKAEKELKIELKYVEATDTNAIESLLRNFARKNYDLVIGVGFAEKDSMSKVAPQFPNVKFAIIDGEVSKPNVRSLMFAEHEGAFIVGALAAMATKTEHVGFVGGMDIPLIRRFSMGYSAGAKYIKPKINVSENYVGVTGEAWNNPAKSKELALTQYGNGADVIFVAAGASNTGVFDAAEDKKKLAIGCDSNQNWIKPGFILTSMFKAVDVAVFDTIKDAQQNKFTGGLVQFGLKNLGVNYTSDKYNEKLLTAEMRTKIEEIKKKIILGQIQVPDYFKRK
jgi:basic membrane protein A